MPQPAGARLDTSTSDAVGVLIRHGRAMRPCEVAAEVGLSPMQAAGLLWHACRRQEWGVRRIGRGRYGMA